MEKVKSPLIVLLSYSAIRPALVLQRCNSSFA